MFFSPRNKDILKNNIIRECENTIGIPFNRNNISRLDKSLNHYMNEIWSTQSQTLMLPALNREVNIVTSREFISYLTKPVASVSKKQIPARTQLQTSMAATQQSSALMSTSPASSTATQLGYAQMSTPLNEIVFQDTERTLEDVRKERQGQQPERPPIPDFRISSDEDGPSPMDLYQMAKAAREREAAALASQISTKEENDSNVFKTVLGNEIIPSHGTLPPPIKTKKSVNEAPLMPPPRIMDPFALDQPTQPSGKQLTLLRQDDVIQYKEIEQNLFINSMDRDWTKDSVLSMNRYNFTVNFDPSAASQTNNLTPFAVKKFRNIVRIQLVKAIISRETLDVLLTKFESGDDDLQAINQINVLSFPSVNVRIAEFQGNNNGTNNRLDDSFGVVHYDAQWTSDPAGNSALTITGQSTSNGYVSLIPKFLTCERIFEPTPLATLQKMSIRLERPTSPALLSEVSDVISVAGLRLSTSVTNTIYSKTTSPSSHIFIRTDKWFSKFMWQVGDRVNFKGVNANLAGGTSATTIASINALEDFINRDEGHSIVAIGTINGSSSGTWNIIDNANSVGYAQVIIIQNRFQDPTTGSTAPYLFGNETDMYNAFDAATEWAGSGINASHQVQLVFKVVTREYDPATKVRPDNTY